MIKLSNFIIRILIFFLSIWGCSNCVFAQAVIRQAYFDVEELSLTKWNSEDGIRYKQVPGANLGATSFDNFDNERLAFLSNSSSEIVIVNKADGKAINRIKVSDAPRDFIYSNGYFYVLLEDNVSQYDTVGNENKKFYFDRAYLGVERLTRVNDTTYLLLPNGNSAMIESNGKTIPIIEKKGWKTQPGYFIETKILEANSYTIILSKENKITFEKQFSTSKKLAGVHVIGATETEIFIDVQTFISENPIQVERFLKSIKMNKNNMESSRREIKIPDCYFVRINKDFIIKNNGTILHMVSAPQGVYVFSIAESQSENIQGYPESLLQIRYHFNDHLMNLHKDNNEK